MNNPRCAWCSPHRPGQPQVRLGMCRRHSLLMLSQRNAATPEELEELWNLLEPRAVTASRVLDVVAWSILVAAFLYLGIHVALWVSRGFPLYFAPDAVVRWVGK